jgi:hypothetical protein
VLKLILTASLIILFITTFTGAQDSVSPAPVSVSDDPNSVPNPKPSNFDRLNEQAKARKIFYRNQASARRTLRDRQKNEMDELLKQHRSSRAKFISAKHSPEERKKFYLNQRHEMNDLKDKQENEKKALTRQLAKQALAFDRQQKKEMKEKN